MGRQRLAGGRCEPVQGTVQGAYPYHDLACRLVPRQHLLWPALVQHLLHKRKHLVARLLQQLHLLPQVVRALLGDQGLAVERDADQVDAASGQLPAGCDIFSTCDRKGVRHAGAR